MTARNATDPSSPSPAAAAAAASVCDCLPMLPLCPAAATIGRARCCYACALHSRKQQGLVHDHDRVPRISCRCTAAVRSDPQSKKGRSGCGSCPHARIALIMVLLSAVAVGGTTALQARSLRLSSPTLFPRATLAASPTVTVTHTPLPPKRMDSPTAAFHSRTSEAITAADPSPSADAASVNNGTNPPTNTLAFSWDSGVILALVLVAVFAVGVGMIVVRHYLRRRRHRLTMAALANMRGGRGTGPRGTVPGSECARNPRFPSMTRVVRGHGGYASANRGTISSNHVYSHYQQATPGPGGKRPLDGDPGALHVVRTGTATSSPTSSLSRMERGKSASPTTMVPSSSSSSVSSLLQTPGSNGDQAPPHLPLPSGLSINTDPAQGLGDRGYQSTRRQTVNSIQWIPAPSSGIFTPLDLMDSNSTIDFFDALQLAPPVPQLPQPALLRICNNASSCLSIASDSSWVPSPSPLSASPASSYCSATSTTARPDSAVSSMASFASMATVGSSSSLASAGRRPTFPSSPLSASIPSRSYSTSAFAKPSGSLIPPTPRSMSLPMPSASHITGLFGSSPPSLLSTTSSGSGSYFGSPQVGPIQGTPRSTSLSPLQI